MATYTFNKEDMTLRIQVTQQEPFFERGDIIGSVGVARGTIEPYLPKERWLNYTALIDAIDAAEKGGRGFARKRVNPIYLARIDRLRNWIEWEVIPQLSKLVIG